MVGNREMYMCPICGKIYTTKGNVNRHMNIHLQNAIDNKCVICDKNFDSKEDLEKHYHQHMIPCPQCDKTFKNQKDLEKHMQSIHTEHKCVVCGKNFSNKGNLNKHMKTHTVDIQRRFQCDICGKEYQKENYYHNHRRRHETVDSNLDASVSNNDSPKNEKAKKKRRRNVPETIVARFECTTCGASFTNVDLLRDHLKQYKHPTNINAVQEEYYSNNKNMIGNSTTLKARDVNEALGGVLKVVHFMAVGEQENQMELFLSEIKEEMMRYIGREVKNRTTGVKWHCITTVEFVKISTGDTDPKTEDPELLFSERYLHSYVKTTLPGDSEEMLEDAMDKAIHDMWQFRSKHEKNEGTGWQFNRVMQCRLFMGTFRPLKGSQYIPLPYSIVKTRSVLNIKNSDDKCFLWCVLAHLHHIEGPNANRVTEYLHLKDTVNIKGIKFPVTVNDIVKFEKLNPSISINVFGIEESRDVNNVENIQNTVTYYPLYISKLQSVNRTHINLLIIEKNDKNHYCLIRNLNRMLAGQNKHRARTHFCTNCLHGFSRKELLDKHVPLCISHDPLTVKMPEGNDAMMKFNAIDKMLEMPYVIYADFECVLEKINENDANDSYRKETTLERKNEHKPCGYSYLVVSRVEDDQEYSAVTYSGENVLKHFFENIISEVEKLLNKMKYKKNIIMSQTDIAHHQLCNICHICNNVILQSDHKVKDHCHLTGKYRGPAHNECNLKYQLKKFIPVFFHNLEGYDSHLLMQQLGKYKKFRVSCIAKNMEKYISFTLGSIRFLDSLNFMNESLEKLVANLVVEGDVHLHQLKKHFPNYDERSLLMRKGVYPYEWMDSLNKMNNDTLPSKEEFYSSLTMKHISDADYAHAQKVWSTFKMKTMQEYHDLYLLTDVLLLADCFENFRSKCIEFYKLDPAHFYTTPGLSWCAALKMTDISLELITDIDMHLMVEKGVRGGVSTIVNRYCQANNKYMSYNSDKPNIVYNYTEPNLYILDLDANNLYGWAMSQPLPTGDFKWLNDDGELSSLNEKLLNITDSSDVGYILEVDLEIPKNLHDYFNEYVPAPEHLSVSEDMLSSFSRDCLKKLNLKHTSGTKLIPNLYNKEKYVVHHKALQCYVQLGLKILKIHRAIEFRQTPWLKEYIEFNTKQRQLAKNNFEKNFFKLMNNSVFGKTIENLRNRVTVELVHNDTRFLKLVAKPHIHSFQRFNDDLVAVKLKMRSIKMNRPNYAGMVILDYAKFLMYDFYYNVIKNRYGNSAHLLFTDTDSLCISVETEDVYKDMLDMEEHLDFSDYPVDHYLHSSKNKKVLGKFKDEMNGALILEYVGLRAKMYSILWSRGCVKTCKGINKAVNKLILKHDMYRECLFETHFRVDTIVRIGSLGHQLYTFENKKMSLSPYDDKRYVSENKIETLAFGHYKII